MLETNEDVLLQRRRRTIRMKKVNLRVDMTPMVDLGFLLIAFFILTTQLSQPAVLNLYMPNDKGIETDFPESKALTILIGKNDELFYYFGREEEAFKNKSIKASSFSVLNGIGDIIRKKQNQLEIKNLHGKDELMVVIKPGSASSYKHIVDILDEMLINKVKRYAIVDPTDPENSFLVTGFHP